MLRFGFFKSNKKTVSEAAPASPETSETLNKIQSEEEQATDTAVSSRQYWNSGMSAQDWICEMYREQERKGAFEHLAGKGKPLDVRSGEVMNCILKEANYLPVWLTLQHEIRDRLQRLLEVEATVDLESALQELNEKIAKYNSIVPSPMLQKWKITRENMRQQFERWK